MSICFRENRIFFPEIVFFYGLFRTGQKYCTKPTMDFCGNCQKRRTGDCPCPSGNFLVLYAERSAYFARACSAAASFAAQTKTSIAFWSSSSVGNVGEMRIFSSSGSTPWGKDAPAPVRTTPASLHRETMRFAQPFWLKEMK